MPTGSALARPRDVEEISNLGVYKGSAKRTAVLEQVAKEQLERRSVPWSSRLLFYAS